MDSSNPSQIARFRVEGMTCQNCARHVREAAESVAGVSRATVDLGRGNLTLRWNPDGTRDGAAVAAAIGKAGFRAEELPDAKGGSAGARYEGGSAGHGWRLNVILGGVVTAVLMVAEWGLGWSHFKWFGWLAFALALPVQVFCGARFYRGAWAQLRRGASNMDTLVALGSTAAFGFSVWVVFRGAGGHVYFMESAAIITLISVGHWLEALASQRAAGAIRALMGLAPTTARRLGPDGAETTIAVEELLPGDRIVLGPGERVPTDAEVVEGASAVDEAMLTGEAKPVEKQAGAKVYAGTSNLDGRIVARVDAIGDATALAQIIAAVERAQNSRAGIQRLADKVSAVFVPSVIGLAILTALAWGLASEQAAAAHAWMGRWLWTMELPGTPLAAAVIHATSVLIVACPCAMGLATPAAIMAGTNAAALRGILIRDGVALEKAGRIDTVVFDKTGTLTVGAMEVSQVRDWRAEEARGETVGSIVAAVARGSHHPVSKALARWGTAAGAEVGMAGGKWVDWREQRGAGIEARRAGEESVVYRLGSLTWLEESGVAGAVANGGDGAGRGTVSTYVGLAAGAQLLATFELRDVLRPEARQVVSALHRDGFLVYLLSGDGWLAAEAAAREVGIPASHVMARVKPEQKAEAIERLQKEGRRIAFVGDGLNDGPALARADLGIAMSRATDVARESADVLLIRPGLERLREAMGLAQATLRTIRQNLFWAFFYNAAAVPLAMLGFFTPVLCAAAMGFSDLLVIGNAFRLRYWSLRGDPPHPGPSES